MNKPGHLRTNRNRDGASKNHRASKSRATELTARQRSRPLIAVFGSSQPKPSDELYSTGVRLGELLGSAGFDVMNGGYRGVMEAVSRGAHAAGAHVIGVTMRRFEDRVNRYVGEEVRTANFYERFGLLVNRADGYIAMHGGIGTLAEVSFTWQELLLGMLTKRPLILLGPQWRRLYAVFERTLIPTPRIYEPLTLIDTPEAAVEFLRSHFKLPVPSQQKPAQ
jgi:uncharacterized protein (TIGR00730 family)